MEDVGDGEALLDMDRGPIDDIKEIVALSVEAIEHLKKKGFETIDDLDCPKEKDIGTTLSVDSFMCVRKKLARWLFRAANPRTQTKKAANAMNHSLIRQRVLHKSLNAMHPIYIAEPLIAKCPCVFCPVLR